MFFHEGMVSAINAKQVEVKFNQAVDADTLFNDTTGIKTANVSISRTTQDATTAAKNLPNVAGTTGSLSDDGKTLTLTLPVANTDYLDGTYVVTVTEAVKSKDQSKTLKAYTGTFSTSDVKNPVVTGATYSVTSGFKLTLSEPVSTLPSTIRVNGVDVQGSATLADDNTTIVVPKPVGVAAGSTVTLYVAGSTDFAGNQLSPFNGSTVVTNDTTAVQITSLTQATSNKVRVVFNKPIATTDANAKLATTVLRNGVNYTDFTIAKNTAVDKTGKTFDITLGSSTTGPDFGNLYGTNVTSASLVVAFGDQLIADYYGNKLSATSQSINVSKDVTAPTVVSTKLSADGKSIDVKFSQALSAKDAAKMEIRKDGASVTNSVDAATTLIDGTDATVLHVTPGTGLVATPGTTKLASGTYSVRLQDGAVTNVNGITVSGSTLPNVSVGSTTTDLTVSTVNNGVAAAGFNKFKVTFSEAVTGATALNAANYKLDGVALPAGTDVRFDGSAATGTVVLIDLPANTVNIGSVTNGTNAALHVSGVTTASNKTVLAKYDIVKVADNTASTLQSASLIASNVIKLSFDENLSGTFADIADILDDLAISAGGTSFAATDATATATISGKDVIITVTPGPTSNWTAVTTASTVTVKTLSGDQDIKDANGLAAKGNVSVTLAK